MSDPLATAWEVFGAVSGASASKSKRRGRPLGRKALEIRDAVEGLTLEHERMTVRQVFYALTVRGVVPKAENAGYRPVQTQVLKMRREGLLEWDFIADGTRWQRKPPTWNELDDAMAHMARTYRRNLWQRQKVRIEVWLEKDALAEIAIQATEPWDVPLMVSRGTSSATFLHSAAKAAEAAWRSQVETVVFALYDLDAAGNRAARSVERGLREHAPGVPITFRQLAVTEDQAQEWGLPSRPAKASDPEAAKFGGRAVELDAIPPDRLVALIEGAIKEYVDPRAWAIEKPTEREERQGLAELLDWEPTVNGRAG